MGVVEVHSGPFNVVIVHSKSDLCVGCDEAFMLQLSYEHFKIVGDLLLSLSWLLWA